MLIVLFKWYFLVEKLYFFVFFIFLCLLCSLKDYLFQCVVSNVYHQVHMLFFRVLHEREILCLIVYDLGVFQVRLDVLSLERLENLQVSCLCLYWL